MNVLLTTFPAHKSRNVGDSLITRSTIKLIQSRSPAFRAELLFRGSPLDGYRDGEVKSVIAPGFSVSEGVYPELFKLYSDLRRLPPFYPIGCSFQHEVPATSSFMDYEYGQETLEFLKFIVEKSGPLPCRDALILQRLEKFGVKAVFSGDLGLFDDEMAYRKFMPPKDIKSIVVTTPHHTKCNSQSLQLIRLLRQEYPNAKLFVALHSRPTPSVSLDIVAEAAKLGCSELHLYGDAENLNVYDSMDVHVGYRMHGHIAFLRKRRPSVLFVEDARAFGFAHTDGLDFGCFLALSENGEPAEYAPSMVGKFLREQIAERFAGYQRVFSFIDKTYHDFICPYFSNLARTLECASRGS